MTKGVRGVNEVIFTTSKDRLLSYEIALFALNSFIDELKPEYFNVSDLTYDRIKLCRRLYKEIKEDDRKFILNIDQDIVIHADKSRLTRVIENLVMDAMKHCKKGNIGISLQKEDTGVYFTVSDEEIRGRRIYSVCSIHLGFSLK